MIYLGLKWIGISRKSSSENRQNECYFWLLGAALFSHALAFFGISYFDQTRYSWCALLAMISALTGPKLARATVPADGLETCFQGIPLPQDNESQVCR